MLGIEILKQPVKTAVILNVGDFEELRVQEKLHSIISVKDFKAIVTHANALDTTLSAYYSSPGRPLQFNCRKDDLYCQFTVMTAGDNRKTPTASTTTTTTASSSRRASVQPQGASFEQRQASSKTMPPPARPEARRNPQSLGKRTSTSTSTATESQAQESDSLFVPADDGDRLWDPQNLADNEESVGWDASEDNVPPSLRSVNLQLADRHRLMLFVLESGTLVLYRSLVLRRVLKVFRQHRGFLK
jgi:cell cycle checkpoint control protein RAD9A